MNIKKIFNERYIAKCNYYNYVRKLLLDNRVILLESQQGKEYTGNIYYIAKELASDDRYSSYSVLVCVRKNKIKEAESFYHSRGIEKVQFVECFSDRYYRSVATAKYLISDNTFLFFFVKRPGQVYLNTWHGTPLKTLGKEIKDDLHNIGNTQRNFLASDFLLFPNEYTKTHMVRDYMLENLCQNTCLLHGYPRNTAFFNDVLKAEIREKLNLNGKKVVAYMPTWRGSLGKKNTAISEANMQYILEELNTRLGEDYSVFVNLHPIESASVDFDIYENIQTFPSEYETYEFLSAVDVLVTDYSSVFFDYLNTNGKVVLYAYDKEYYLSTRGLYLPLESLPFPIVDTMDDLINEIVSPKQYDDSDFRAEFCSYDGPDATKLLCERVILGKEGVVKEDSIKDNGKENVFIFPGRLASNGITVALRNLLNNLDLEKRNYYLLIESKPVAAHLDTLREFSEKINYLTIKGRMNLSLLGKILLWLYNKKFIKTSFFQRKMHEAYELELQRIFSGARVDDIIHYSGYSTKKINLFANFPKNKVVFVHANMQAEMELRSNQRSDALEYAYGMYDSVAVVTEDTVAPTAEIAKTDKRIRVCHNVIDDAGIRSRAMEDFRLDETTTVYPSVSCLFEALESDAVKILNVGRFSPEKGQMRLIDAFANLGESANNAKLIIVGGSSWGSYYDQIVKHVEDLSLQDRVVLVKGLSNPFPLVKRCDYSVLTSYAEGFGLVLAEADVLGKPVFSVDIPGPRTFMRQHGGCLVSNDEEGIIRGLKACIAGNLKCMNVDYDAYNRRALEEFDALLSK